MAIPPIPPNLALQIVSADRLLVQDQVDEVEIPGDGGYLGVLPGHTPLLSLLHVGELWYRKGHEKSYLSIAFGFAEIQPDRVTILAEIAEKAEEQLARPTIDMDFERARIALLKSLIRLQVASRARIRS